jgi:hypothetical protein
MAQIDLARVSTVLERFMRTGLSGTLSSIESAVRGLTAANCANTLSDAGVTGEVLSAAGLLKRLAGQVNVAIHATGILLCLPHILEAGEAVEYVSLGAGNTGRKFDLQTNRRIAEFKFIHWRGGAESIRQNQLFKDFYLLVESKSMKAQVPLRARHRDPTAFPQWWPRSEQRIEPERKIAQRSPDPARNQIQEGARLLLGASAPGRD